MQRRGGDRRVHMRFEVLGDLVGTLETRTLLPIRDISLSGALVESRVPLALGAIHRVAAVGDSGPFELTLKVVRADANGASGPYLLGVEFISLTAFASAQIQAWMTEANGAETTVGG